MRVCRPCVRGEHQACQGWCPCSTTSHTTPAKPIPVKPKPAVRARMVLPQRVKGRPWCPECGMSIGHHWPGCSKPEWTVGTDSPHQPSYVVLSDSGGLATLPPAVNRPAPIERLSPRGSE